MHKNNDWAVVFPGQGAQYVGMLGDAAKHFPEIRETFTQASERLGFDTWAMASSGPEQALGRTENTQPLLLCASVALWRSFERLCTVRPAFFAGHSLGEYSALVCSGALAFEQALDVVRLRGQLMQQAVPEGSGAMAAILGLNLDQVRVACKQARAFGVVEPANLNAPGQIVISGAKPAVDQAMEAAKTLGARRAVSLAVSAPSHCSLMSGAAQALAETLMKTPMTRPETPVLNNVDVRVETSPDGIRNALVRQLYCPVRWSENIEWLAAQGIRRLAECGPGRVLGGLVRRIDKSLACVAMEAPESMNALAADLQRAYSAESK